MTRSVVVTGGGTGIGRATALALARDGERVMIVGRRPDVLRRAAAEIAAAAPEAPPVVTAAADLADPAQVERLRSRVAGELAPVGVLVHAAGGNTDLRPPAAAPDGLAGIAGRWLDNLRQNVLTAVLATEALRDLLASPGGRIVLVSSIAAYRGSGGGSYGAAKAALHPYAFDLAAALGPRGVTVNVVAPGFVAGTEFFGDALTPQRREALVAQTHTGRPGAPEDVAETIRWLASDAAGHVTAQILQVNGGAERGH
jgi:3-oxoacyl-[acyl-carrier protein] reductase